MEIRIRLEDDMNKAHEIAILDKLQATFEKVPNNYLPTLFSSAFVGWASNRIKDDFPLDVMEYIQDFDKDQQIAQLTEELTAEMERKVEVSALKEQVEQQLKNAHSAFQRDQADWFEEKEALNEEIQTKTMQCINYKEQNDALMLDIRDLKVKMYDLSTKNN